MTVKELITYLLNFKMDSEVVFVDQNNEINHMTTDPHTYLGNGKIDTEVNEVKLISTKTKHVSKITGNRVYFISGHRDITQDEFDWYYLTILDKLCDDPHCTFVVGDCQGTDTMAQEALLELGVSPSRVTVYHMLERPRNLASEYFNLKGGYTTDEERDNAMTHDSTDDVAWIRKGKEKSGTAKNILRRYMMHNN